MAKKGILSKQMTKDAIEDVTSREVYGSGLDDDGMSRVDRLNLLNRALTDIHLALLASGRISATEAKNFRYFVKEEMADLMKAGPKDGEKVREMLHALISSAYDSYIRFKLRSIDEIKRKRVARVDQILERGNKRRSGTRRGH